jgi:hypothetical protein
MPVALQLSASGAGVFDLLSFHSQRGVQLESSYASIMAVAREFGVPARIQMWTGGVNLDGPLAPALRACSTAAMAGLVAALVWWRLARGRHAADRTTLAWRLTLLTVVGIVAVSKVFSPQYLVWALPATLLLSLDVARSRRDMVVAAALVAGLAGLTTWVFPYHYFGFDASAAGLAPRDPADLEGTSSSFLLIGLRNALYVVLAGWLGWRTWRGQPGASQR